VDTRESEGDDPQFYDKVPKQFLYSREQAAALSMSKTRLDELIRDRKIIAVRHGRRVKFTTADLEAYIDSLPH